MCSPSCTSTAGTTSSSSLRASPCSCSRRWIPPAWSPPASGRWPRTGATTPSIRSRRRETRWRSSFPRKACPSSSRPPPSPPSRRIRTRPGSSPTSSSAARSSRSSPTPKASTPAIPRSRTRPTAPSSASSSSSSSIPRSWRSATRRSRRASWSSSGPDPPLAMPRELTAPLRPLPSRLEGLDRSAPVWIVAAAALLLLMLLPLAWLGYLSVSGEGGFTLAHYGRVFTDPRFQKALWNTVVLAFLSGLLSLALGAPMAWLTARTDLPGKRIIRGLTLASFVTPPFLGAFAWVMLAGPNAGYLNKLYRGLTGAEEPLLNIFSMPGLIFVVAIYTFPYVYIMIANTLGLIASDLEDAAAILGAGRFQVARTITLPMVLPAILSGFILAVLQALALFGSPAILALPAGFHTVTTQLWAFFQYPPRVEMAAAFSI